MKYLFLIIFLVSCTGTRDNEWSVGDGTAGDKAIVFNNDSANKPTIKFDDTSGEIRFSNDGSSFESIGGTSLRYREVTLDLAPTADFTTGTVEVVRIGKNVTISFSNITHPPDDQRVAPDLIPIWARPDGQNRFNTYMVDTSGPSRVAIRTNGQFDINYLNTNFSTAIGRSSTFGGSISYNTPEQCDPLDVIPLYLAESPAICDAANEGSGNCEEEYLDWATYADANAAAAALGYGNPVYEQAVANLWNNIDALFACSNNDPNVIGEIESSCQSECGL